MNFQIPGIHRSKVSNFTERWKKNQNLKILYFCQNLTESYQKLIGLARGLLISPNQNIKYEGSSLNTFRDILHTRFSNFVFKGKLLRKGA